MKIRRLVISLAVAASLLPAPVLVEAQAAGWGKTDKKKKAIASDDYTLTETSGPWLIMAATFTGEGAEEQARLLVKELRGKYKLKAYVYQKKFDFSKGVEGRGVDRYGAPTQMRYQNGNVVETAVLVGDYAQIDDETARKTLKTIKYMQPDALTKVANTTQTMAAIHAIQKAAIPRDSADQEKGPMGGAFLTTNPLLPHEFFVPKGVDKFVVNLNADLKYSLLNCKKKYTVRVATFHGQSVMLTPKVMEQMKKGSEMKSRLVDAAKKAHTLTETLRAKGVEAWEFHDRTASFVTVGSFDSIGNTQPNGQVELSPMIVAVMQKYGAEKPNSGSQNQIGKPKTEGGVAFDVQPLPVEVPQRSIAADYARSTVTR